MFRRILNKLLHPDAVVVMLLVILATLMLVRTLAIEKVGSVVAIAVYAFSTYVLAVICVRIPSLYRNVKRILENNRFIRRYIKDAHWRVRISLLGSVSLNILYVIMMLSSGIFLKANWFYALATYYLLLIIMRIFLIRDTSKLVPGENRLKEFYRYRFCGILMLIMNQALSVIVTYVVYRNKGFEYSAIHTITMAVYTFAAMIVAIVNVVRYRRFESPLMSAAKAISLASAVVSLLSLETTVVAAFGGNDNPEFRRSLTALTGFVICTFVLGMAVYMIVHANKQIKILKKGERKNGK